MLLALSRSVTVHPPGSVDAERQQTHCSSRQRATVVAETEGGCGGPSCRRVCFGLRWRGHVGESTRRARRGGALTRLRAGLSEPRPGVALQSRGEDAAPCALRPPHPGDVPPTHWYSRCPVRKLRAASVRDVSSACRSLCLLSTCCFADSWHAACWR